MPDDQFPIFNSIAEFEWWQQKMQTVTTRYCPGCEPDRDPFAELLESQPCSQHNADDGVLDGKVKAPHIFVTDPGF